MKMSKGWIYSIITMAVSAAYMVIVFAADFAMKNLGTYTAGWGKPAALFVLVLLFQPIMSRLQTMIDKKFFKTNIEAEVIREKFSTGIKKLTKIDELAEYINRVAFRTFKLSGSAVFVFDEDTGKYMCYDARGILAGMNEAILGKDDILVYECAKGEIIARKHKGFYRREIYDEMRKMNIDLCVPSYSKKKKKLVGFLLVGEKISQDAFSNEELLLLETMSNQAVMSVENAILYQARIEAAKKRLLIKRLSDLGQAASNVAKQARMALTPIMDFSIQFRQKWDDDSFMDIATEKLPFETEKLRLILMSILIYSRDTKKAEENADLCPVMQWLEKLMSAQARDRKIAAQYECAEGLAIKMDRDNIKHILLNLIINSFDAMPFGGKISVKAVRQDGKIFISMHDSGQGIAEENIQKIFDPFYSTKQNAIGLGLTVVKKIIESHDGTIVVKSEPGKGTIVEIELTALPAGRQASL